MEFQEKIEANVDRVIAESLDVNGSGALKGFLEKKRGEIEEAVFLDYNKAHTMRGAPERAPKDLQKDVDAQFETYVNGDGNSLRNALIGAAGGEQHAKIGLNDITQMTDGFGAVASNMATGNILGLITSVPSLLANSFIGDYVKAAFSYFLGGKDKPESFKQALAEVRLTKGVNAVAGQLGVDGAALTAELLKEPSAPASSPSPTTPVSDIKVDGMTTNAVPDPSFTGANGIPHEGGPGTSPAAPAQNAVPSR